MLSPETRCLIENAVEALIALLDAADAPGAELESDELEVLSEDDGVVEAAALIAWGAA